MSSHTALQQLFEAISLLNTSAEAEAFFKDLCTIAELEAMSDRWQVVLLLQQQMPYRVIHEKTGVSMTTITRVARALTLGEGGYHLIATRKK
ncbi:MAG TPA: YerC/YecD family TrpR-related protein [Legionellaceae bacterium]|nr:YerC/YecD family TrpR-related protein [Legionellaceae bacterium]